MLWGKGASGGLESGIKVGYLRQGLSAEPPSRGLSSSYVIIKKEPTESPENPKITTIQYGLIHYLLNRRSLSEIR